MGDGVIIKRCTFCGEGFTAKTWADLPLVGHHTDEVESLELRNCTCQDGKGTAPTLAIVVASILKVAS